MGRGRKIEDEVARFLIREFRLKMRVRQTTIADRLQEPQSFISKVESGERRLTFGDVARICDAMSVPLPEFTKAFQRRLRAGAAAAAESKARYRDKRQR